MAMPLRSMATAASLSSGQTIMWAWSPIPPTLNRSENIWHIRFCAVPQFGCCVNSCRLPRCARGLWASRIPPWRGVHVERGPSTMHCGREKSPLPIRSQSLATNRPPGFSTRRISANKAGLSGIWTMESFEKTTSKREASKGSPRCRFPPSREQFHPLRPGRGSRLPILAGSVFIVRCRSYPSKTLPGADPESNRAAGRWSSP
jgi:hypothetical protein